MSRCQAGGVGHVDDGDVVIPTRNGTVGPGGQVGRWLRTLSVTCKVDSGELSPAYHVIVKDKNWAGTWLIRVGDLNKLPSNSGIPTC